ncbi:hypothetical protein [Dyella terrae]|uniref:hypothetical protein n=1 Tax=Dyella terrae TaxID=522259 RepID=UPI003D18DC45|nr:hypothetical protein DYST_03834 [Dyella terrae]
MIHKNSSVAPHGSSMPMSQRLGALLWPSFFVAGVVTVVFFSFIDPMALRDITFPSLKMGRELGYTLGFFLIWLATASSSLFTWILLRPSREVKSTTRSGKAS